MKRVFAAIAIFALLPIAAFAQVKPSAYEVSLSWQAPASSPDPVASYNAYRAPQGSSAFALLNTAAILPTSYVDPTVQGGQTYDYIVESVDASGVTSAPSNVAVVPIPPVPPIVGKATVVSTP